MQKLLVLFLWLTLLQNSWGQCVDHALHIDGNTEYIELAPLPSSFAPNSNFTVQMNFKSESFSGSNICPGIFRRLFSLGSIAAPGSRFEIGECGGMLVIFWFSTTTASIGPIVLSQVNIRDNQWHCISVTRSASTVEVWLDGGSAPIYSAAGPNTLNTTKFRVGQWTGSSTGTQEWEGPVDNIRLWSKVLTNNELGSCVSCPLTGQEDGLVLSWNLDEGIAGGNNTGITTVASPNGNNGTLYGFMLNDVASSNFICSGVTVGVDNVPPVIVCPPGFTAACATFGVTAPQLATATDNCAVVSITYSDDPYNITCEGIIRRIWVATDASGNTSTCLQKIIVIDNTPSTIVCPPNFTVNTLPNQCYYSGTLPMPTATDECQQNLQIQCGILVQGVLTAITPLTQFPKGNTVINCRAFDACGNVSPTCTTTITVVDNQPPTITCPASVTVVGTIIPPAQQCKVVVNGLAPTAADNCPMLNVSYVISNPTPATGVSNASGTNFMQGVSTVTYTATDMAGNTATCNFVVTVNCQQQSDFPGFKCGQAVITCFSGFLPGTTTLNPSGPVLATVDIRDQSAAPHGTNWPIAGSGGIYHKSDWDANNMGQVFGLTIDGNNNIYASATTIYGYYLPTGMSNAAYGNVYKIDAITGNVSVFATLPQNLTNPSGLGDIWYDAPNNQFFVSNFYDGKIYRLNAAGLPLDMYDFAGTTYGTPSPGFIARGERVWAVATYNNKLYFSVWNEDHYRPNSGVKNQIYSVALSGGIPTGSATLVHDMSNFTSTVTQIYSNPVSDIHFSQTGNMLVAERSMNNDFGNSSINVGEQAHRSRIIELSPVNTWSSERIYYVGNTSYDGSGGFPMNYHANSAGGVDYGYESYNPSAAPAPSKCDSMVWGTGDALRAPGWNDFLIDPLSPLCANGYGGGLNDWNYGIAGIRWTGNSNNPSDLINYVKTSSIYIDIDNNLCDHDKTQFGDLDIFKCGCTQQASLCDSISVSSMSMNSQQNQDSCCYKLTVTNSKPSYFTGIQVCAPAGVSLSSIAAPAGWNIIGYTASMVSLIPSGPFIPVGNSDFLKFCLSNYQNVPTQQVIVKYFGPDFTVICMDTLTYECTQKPKCLTATAEVTCGQNGTYTMTFDVMSNINIGFNVNSIQLNAPPGVVFTPSMFNMSPTLTPSMTQTGFVTTVSGSVTDGQTICFSITAKSSPIGQNDTNCCTDTVMKVCVILPECICDKVSAAAVPVDIQGDDCCWKVNLTNNYSPTYFSGVKLDIITPGVIFSAINNMIGSGWTSPIGTTTGTHVEFDKINPGGTTIPVSSMLPSFCLGNILNLSQVPQVVVLSWINTNGECVCTDTLRFSCQPPDTSDCAVLVNPKIECNPIGLGTYTFTFQVKNTSNFVANEVSLSNVMPVGAVSPNPYYFTIPGGLAINATSSTFTVTIVGMSAGSNLCFNLGLHNIANGIELECCASAEYCIPVPPCNNNCACLSEKINLVQGNQVYQIGCNVSPNQIPKLNCPVQPILISGTFGCIGSNGAACPSTVFWTLDRPTLADLTGSQAASSININFTAAQISAPGTYILTFKTVCPGSQDTCICVSKWVQRDCNNTCCDDLQAFQQNAINAFSVTADNANCKAIVNIGPLDNCFLFGYVNWGDGTLSGGPMVSGAMAMHTYTTGGTYTVGSYAVAYNPTTGEICSEFYVSQEVTINCYTPCGCNQGFNNGVDAGFLQSSLEGNCLRKFEPIALCPNDQVVWYINGVFAANSAGNAPVSLTVPLNYGTVCMAVARFEGANVCRDTFCSSTFCIPELITDCGGISNSGFANNIDGFINEDVVIDKWEWLTGNVFAFANEGISEGNLMFTAKKDVLAEIKQIGIVPNPNTIISEIYVDVENYDLTAIKQGSKLVFLGQKTPATPEIIAEMDASVFRKGWDGTIKGGINKPLIYDQFFIRFVSESNTNERVRIDNICITYSTSTKEDDVVSDFKILPNPNNGTFNVELPKEAEDGMRLRIIDLAGRLMEEKSTETGSKIQTIAAQQLPEGLYFLQIVSEGKVLAVKKFVKQ
jgi:hypothetical protein